MSGSTTIRPARLRARAGRVAGALAALTVVLLAGPGTVPASAATPMILGAAGDVSGLSGRVGAPLAYHAYGQLSGGVPVGRWVNMKPAVDWRTVAAAAPGSATYNDITRWAAALRVRSGPILFTFSHEPEASGNVSKGTSTDFVNAYRHVVDVFRAQGVRNVEYTLQLTSYAFQVAATDRRAAARWYPGDGYVDNVASDPYNWYDCGSGRGRWDELATVWTPTLRFARSHGKAAAIGEFASQIDPADPTHRAQWLRNANSFLIANSADVRAVMYFQTTDRPDCHWPLASSADFSAFATMAKDTAHYRGN